MSNLLQTIRVGVIGLGVGERHLRAYEALPEVSVVAICDTDLKKLKEVGDRNNIENRHQDYHAITQDPAIDVVSICSHDNFHAEQAISAFLNGKHVMVEKPVALNRIEAEAVLRAQQDSGKFITSNLILRASPRFQEIKNLIDDGEFGDIFCIEGDYLHQILWKLTSGWRGKMDFYCVIYGGGIHLIDLMRWLLGKEIEEVCGMASNVLTRHTDYKYDDSIFNLLRFENGAIGKCLTTFGAKRPQLHALNIYGESRTFVNDMPHAKLFCGEDAGDVRNVITPYPGIEKGDLLPDFIAAVREDREPQVSAVDVFRVMDVCLASWESIKKRRTIKVNYMI